MSFKAALNYSPITITGTDHNWVFGTYDDYSFCAKIFELPSNFGMPEARRVSKLHIKDASGAVVFNYDRGLDVDSPIGAIVASELEAVVK